MPKMRILSGEQKGAVVEMTLPEAQTAYCTGFAEQVADDPKPARLVPKQKQKPEPKSEKKQKPEG